MGEVRAVGRGFNIRGEKGGMEDRVNAGAPAKREVEAEGDVIDNGKDGEGTMPARGEFQGRSEGGHVFAFKPNLITNGEKGKLWLIVAPILPREVGKSLSGDYIGTKTRHGIEVFLDRRKRRRGKGTRKGVRVETHECKEGHMINGGMKAVVVHELGRSEVMGPIVLTNGGIGTKILLKRLVDTLSLTIGLGVISRRHGLFNAEEGTEATEEGGSELGTAIGD